MKQLFPAQQRAKDFFVNLHRNKGLNSLDTSMVGTGKTVVSVSLAAQLLISAAQQKYKLHLLSATACEDPTEMRALGFAIKLHSLNVAAAPLRGWVGWMYSVGCNQDTWGGWYLRDKEKLADLHEQIYGPNGVGYTLLDEKTDLG